MTKETILASANDEQQEAIKHQEGACMIIAGPGSGRNIQKTCRLKTKSQKS